MRRGGGLPGRRVAGGAWDCSPMGLLGAGALGRGTAHLGRLEMTAGDFARVLAGGRVRFLLASVLQHAIDYRIEAGKHSPPNSPATCKDFGARRVANYCLCTALVAAAAKLHRALPLANKLAGPPQTSTNCCARR